MTIDETFNNLKDNLYKPLIFYVPRSIIPEDKKELFSASKFDSVFHRIAIINKKGDIQELKSNIKLIQLLEKPSCLDNNIFLLLEKKEILKPNPFNFLLEKYIEQLNFYVLISDWMDKNIAVDIPDLDSGIKSYFELQKKIFQKHLEVFQNNFLSNTTSLSKPVDVFKYIKKDFPPFKHFINIQNESDLRPNLNTNKKKGSNRKQKPILITDDESKNFLLSTVFKLKL